MNLQQLAQLPAAQLAAMLADAKRECSHPKLLAWDVLEAVRDCVDCKGTGQVYIFPDVVREAKCQIGSFHMRHFDTGGCRGTKKVVAMSLEVWIAMVKHLGYDGLHISFIKGNYWIWFDRPIGSDGMYTLPDASGEGDIVLEALLRALHMAKTIKKLGKK